MTTAPATPVNPAARVARLCDCGGCSICAIIDAQAGVYTPKPAIAKLMKPTTAAKPTVRQRRDTGLPSPAPTPAPTTPVTPTTQPHAQPHAPASPYLPADPANPHTLTYLFVSRRLDLRTLPRSPLTTSPVIHFGAVPYYRVTHAVFAWVERSLDAAMPAMPQDQRQTAYRAYADLCAYANAALVLDAITHARSHPVDLPAIPYCPEA